MEDFNNDQINDNSPVNDTEPFFSPERIRIMRKKEKRGIFSIGLVAGACVIGYVLLENLLSLPFSLSEKLWYLYKSNDVITYTVSIFLSISCLMIPFLTGGAYLRKLTKVRYKFFNKPNDIILSVYAVPMGIFACIVGNYLTNIFVSAMKSIGFTLTSPDSTTPSTISGRIVYVIAIAVVPPIVEEIAMRGCIMQPLRKYGDRFAIIMTAFLFAVLHGNLVQAPFAFVAGLAFGYITCATGSLIPSMLVHGLNNLYSVFIDFLVADVQDGRIQNVVYITTEMILTCGGAIATVFFIFRMNHRKLRNPVTMLNPAEKASSFILNPSMAVALALMIYITSNYVSYSPVI